MTTPGAQGAGRGSAGRQDVTDLSSISEVREWLRHLTGNERANERWPRYRTGEREPIPWYVRRAVYERDGRRCLACGRPLAYQDAQLDHIEPWSARGPDWSDNLRILCEPCNAERSNFHGSLDTWAARRPPVTFWCISCADYCDDDDCGFCNGEDREDDEDKSHPVTPGMVPAYCAHCGIVSPAWETF